MNPKIMIVRGVLAFILGLILTFWPAGTLETILLFFPFFIIIDGISAIYLGMQGPSENRWLAFIPMGVLEIMLGIFVFIWPGLTLEIFVLIMALWAFVLGFGELFIALADKKLSSGMRWMFAFGAIFTLILAVLIILYPIFTSVFILWLFGVYFIVYGILVFITSWRISASKSK